MLCAGGTSPRALGATILEGHKLLENVQRRAMGMVKSLECKTYKEQLRSFGLFGPEHSRLTGGLMMTCKSTQGAEG